MKKILYMLLILSTFVSCINLDEEPLAQIKYADFFKTTTDATYAVNGVYKNLTVPSGGSWGFFNRLSTVTWGCAGDNTTPGVKSPNPDYRAITLFAASTSNSNYLQSWQEGYEVINRANLAIDKIPQINDTAVVARARLVNEAKFVRGLIYYYLVRVYGPIPLVLHPTITIGDNQSIAQSDTATVFKQIKSDFNDALQLPSKSSYATADQYRASKDAARALLLSVAITQGQWAEAINQYNALNAIGTHTLATNYKDIFGLTAAQKNHSEHIFDAWNYTNDALNYNMCASTESPIYGAPQIGKNKKGVLIVGTAAEYPGATLRRIFRNEDTRIRKIFVDTVYGDVDAKTKIYQPHFDKWRDSTSTDIKNSGINYPVIRWAEVLLLYAEALNELNRPTEALVAFNKVRSRAFGNKTTFNVTITNKDQLRDSIFDEKRREFANEEHVRWFDLIRINGSGGRLIDKVISSWTNDPVAQGDYWTKAKFDAWNSAYIPQPGDAKYNKYLLFPIPYSEINANPLLIQNPGWE